jgi:hypothetical protein
VRAQGRPLRRPRARRPESGAARRLTRGRPRGGAAWGLGVAILVAALHAPRTDPLTTDSEAYLDVARNVLAGEGLVQRIVDFWRPAVPDPLGLWPPGYPVAIASAARLGLEPERAARAVSVAAFLAFAVAFHALARRAAGERGGALALLLALATPRLGHAAVMAWSEMMYLALATTGLLGIARLADEPGRQGRGPVTVAALAGAAIGLATVTRYIGLLLIPFGVVALTMGRAPARVRWVWLLAALPLPALWLAHNLATFGALAGPGLPASDRDVAAILRATGAGMRWGFLPHGLGAHAWTAALALAGLAAAVMTAVRLGGAAAIAAAYGLCHLVALVVLRARANFNDIGDRYLAPVDPFLWLAVAAALAALGRRGGRGRWAARGIAVVLAAAALFGLGQTLASRPAPPPATARRAVEAEELRRLLGPDGPPVLSDAGHRVRSATGRSAVQIPGARFAMRPFRVADERRWRAAGVAIALLRRDPASMARLDRDVAPVVSRWHAEDSTASFVRYRLP